MPLDQDDGEPTTITKAFPSPGDANTVVLVMRPGAVYGKYLDERKKLTLFVMGEIRWQKMASREGEPDHKEEAARRQAEQRKAKQERELEAFNTNWEKKRLLETEKIKKANTAPPEADEYHDVDSSMHNPESDKAMRDDDLAIEMEDFDLTPQERKAAREEWRASGYAAEGKTLQEFMHSDSYRTWTMTMKGQRPRDTSSPSGHTPEEKKKAKNKKKTSTK